MRLQTVVIQKAWFPFGRDMPGIEERCEHRVVLNERERTTMPKAAAILTDIRTAAQEDEDDPSMTDIAMAAYTCQDVAEFEGIVCADTPTESGR